MKDNQLLRYSRHILLPEIEYSGQEKLLNSHCLVVGAGGLGSPASIYLASSGIGKITICDFDDVDISNLQRQILHSDQSIGKNKALSAAQFLNKVNPEIIITAIGKNLNIKTIGKTSKKLYLEYIKHNNYRKYKNCNLFGMQPRSVLQVGVKYII